MMELLTLSQTQKLAKKMGVILYGSSYWKEIVNFDALVKYGMISPEDMNLIQVIDEPAEVVNAIFRYYESRGFELSAAEREVQLNL
jgi:predicted Rossmann-fold nucleotide-binding protein